MTREIFTLFREIVEGEGATILTAAHDPLVDEYVDGVLQLSDGQIMERENPPSSQLALRPAEARVEFRHFVAIVS